MYRISYGARKTKVYVSGPDIYIRYYQSVNPWTMYGERVKVLTVNDHLGQVVSGIDQQQKNIDIRIKKARNSLFSLPGPAFSYKCHVSPTVKLHLFRTFTCPILRSRLSSFALRKGKIDQVSLFQRKTLKSFLKLSKSAPTPAVHFLLSELPVEGKIHRDMFSLFYQVWYNQNTKIHQIVKYLLQSSNNNSRTWSVNLRHICKMYGLPDPLTWILTDPPSKSQFNQDIKNKIIIYYENELRILANNNSKMKYLNVSLLDLHWRHHPSISGVLTSDEVRKLRPHLKMLCGDYYTYEMKAEQHTGISPHYRLCYHDRDSVSHIISVCQSLSVTRDRIISEMLKLTPLLDTYKGNEEQMTQFILDPSSFNLPQRFNNNDSILISLYRISRDLCFALDKERIIKLCTIQSQ